MSKLLMKRGCQLIAVAMVLVFILLFVYPFKETYATSDLPEPATWAFPDVIECARKIAPRNIEGRIFDQLGLAYSRSEVKKLPIATMSSDDLQKYADIVTTAYPDAVFRQFPVSCKEIPIDQMNETSIANIAYVAHNAIDKSTRERAESCLKEIQKRLTKGHPNTFEANAIWLKGEVTLEERKKKDPRATVDELEIGNDQVVTLYVTYRGAARDKMNRSTISYRLNVFKPDGKPFNDLLDPDTENVCGEGVVPDEHMHDWGISRDAVALSFSKEDDQGIYTFKVIIKDHISGEEVTRVTKIILK
ncbi:MAG: hypothetical protein JW927_07790 [Deltaproteobacteria bacterium]|nr:hypothetical protein [Deltaproteobacteria bacterium]